MAERRACPMHDDLKSYRAVKLAVIVACPLSFCAGWLCCSNSATLLGLGRQLQVQESTACWLERIDGEDITAAFLRLHTNLFSQQILPVSAFGANRPSPTRNAIHRMVGTDAAYNPNRDAVAKSTTRALSRLAFVKFLGRQMRRFAPGVAAAAALEGRAVRCLEWDGKWYLAQYATCKETWSLAYKDSKGFKLPDHKHVFGDLLKLPTQHPDMMGTFDIIFCNQVFEHVARPHIAAMSIAALLRPGGYLMWSAPFLEPTHAIPHDYFRFTVSGAMVLFKDAGLTIVATETGGDSMLTSAYLLGYSAGELNTTQVGETLSIPVTDRELAKFAAGGGKEDLARKLYFSSFLVAQRPRDGSLFTWERVARSSRARQGMLKQQEPRHTSNVTASSVSNATHTVHWKT